MRGAELAGVTLALVFFVGFTVLLPAFVVSWLFDAAFGHALAAIALSMLAVAMVNATASD